MTLIPVPPPHVERARFSLARPVATRISFQLLADQTLPAASMVTSVKFSKAPLPNECRRSPVLVPAGCPFGLSPARYAIPREKPLVVQTSSLPSTLTPHGRVTAPSPL